MLTELKKILSGLHGKILILIIIAVSLFVSVMPIKSVSVIESSSSTETIKGKEAIKIIKDRYEESKGDLSTDRIHKFIDYFNSFGDLTTATVESNRKYPGISNLLFEAYSKEDSVDCNAINREYGDDFYGKNIEKVREN